MKRIYLDSNIWNFLHDKSIDLISEFPPEEYCLFIVGEQILENRAIPKDKQHIKNFIEEKIKEWSVIEDRIFGFYDGRHPPDEQRIGGFNFGRFISIEESQFMNMQKGKIGRIKGKSRLYKQEADVALGARSLHSIVLTLDKKKGPLQDAKSMGGSVIFINDYDASAGRFGDWVRDESEKKRH